MEVFEIDKWKAESFEMRAYLSLFPNLLLKTNSPSCSCSLWPVIYSLDRSNNWKFILLGMYFLKLLITTNIKPILNCSLSVSIYLFCPIIYFLY